MIMWMLGILNALKVGMMELCLQRRLVMGTTRCSMAFRRSQVRRRSLRTGILLKFMVKIWR